MKKTFSMLLVCLLVFSQYAFSQQLLVNKADFFNEEGILNVTIETYWHKLIKQKFIQDKQYAALLTAYLPDSTRISEGVYLSVRGKFRREYCNLPPLKLTFISADSAAPKRLQSFKLISACGFSDGHEQYVLKEYLTYKIYNLLTPKSFRVKLLNIHFKDSSLKKKTFVKPAFLVENLKDIARRNNCKEWKGPKQNTEATNRAQMTLVAIFQYMIGNTDWSVKAMHNIKLITPIGEAHPTPFVIPYDFDYAGLVDTDYAIPDPLLNTVSVKQRVYRGFERTMEEVNEVLSLFNDKKDKIYHLINTFDLLTPASKKGMLIYLDDFYDSIKNAKKVRSIFIDNARTPNSI